MSLITKILKPEEFTAAAIAAGARIPEEFARYVIHQLGERGIIGYRAIPGRAGDEPIYTPLFSARITGFGHDLIPGPLDILQPGRFNSETIAVLLCEKMAGPNGWTNMAEGVKLALIDQVQEFLDQWQQQGVIK